MQTIEDSNKTLHVIRCNFDWIACTQILLEMSYCIEL